MSFLRESHLKAHSRAKHLQDKRYVCTFVIPKGEEDQLGNFGFKRVAGQGGKSVDGGRECGARFTTNQHLKRHLESHQKAFPHVVSFPLCWVLLVEMGLIVLHSVWIIPLAIKVSGNVGRWLDTSEKPTAGCPRGHALIRTLMALRKIAHTPATQNEN